MPKFVDKMNLPQYRYFQDMTVREEERKDMVSDFFTAEHQLNNGNQRGYRDGLMQCLEHKRILTHGNQFSKKRKYDIM